MREHIITPRDADTSCRQLTVAYSQHGTHSTSMLLLTFFWHTGSRLVRSPSLHRKLRGSCVKQHRGRSIAAVVRSAVRGGARAPQEGRRKRGAASCLALMTLKPPRRRAAGAARSNRGRGVGRGARRISWHRLASLWGEDQGAPSGAPWLCGAWPRGRPPRPPPSRNGAAAWRRRVPGPHL